MTSYDCNEGIDILLTLMLKEYKKGKRGSEK